MEAHATSRPIRLLDPLLANQIAAGEVVERPASVIKELLENSLDAGARNITIEIEQGGVALIRVIDDGAGIAGGDLPLALARHATSKVYSQDELNRVSSLGFRGEALASIASVSRLSLSTRSAADEYGWQLDGSGRQAPAAHPVGTTVEVRDLFYNTPARRKFLRSERTEFEHLAEVVRRIALSRSDLALTLRHNQRQVLQVRAADDDTLRERRLLAVCGRPFVAQAVTLAFDAPGLRLSGWLVRPAGARAQADLQYFYINGRMIRDRVVTHAVRQAYGDALYPGRHPAYVLYLEMDPAQVDVNVHPTKHEVRFREARRVHDFLYRALREAVGDASAGTPSGEWEAAPQVREAAASYREAAPAASAGGERIVGQLHGRYLLVEAPGGLRLVDMRRARAVQAGRALREALEREGAVRPQPLLLPVTLVLPRAEVEWLATGATVMQQLGFEVERLGPEQVVVRQIPAPLRQVPPAQLLRSVLTLRCGDSELAVEPAITALATAATEGPAPERPEWEGLVAAIGTAPGQAVATLGMEELARLFGGEGNGE